MPASLRPAGWADHLQAFGYEPVVITRRWDHDIRSARDMSVPTDSNLQHLTSQGYEVISVPVKITFRDRIYARLSGTRWRFISKFFTLWQWLGEQVVPSRLPFYAMYIEADRYLTAHPDVSKVVVSARPFEQFLFGYMLYRKHKVKWVADYRDDWTTSEISEYTPFERLFLFPRMRRQERKWVGSASCITSVSPHYVQKIAGYIGVRGELLLNGYDEVVEKHRQQTEVDPETFRITYNGTLYPSQPIETFLKEVTGLIDMYRDKVHIQLCFPGLAYDTVQASRVMYALKGYEANVIITERMSREEALTIQQNSQLLVMIAHLGKKGIPSSKVFEYIGLMKPILVYPNDHDVLEELMERYDPGCVAETPEEIHAVLVTHVEGFLNNTSQPVTIRPEIVERFSRKKQTEVLAGILNSI